MALGAASGRRAHDARMHIRIDFLTVPSPCKVSGERTFASFQSKDIPQGAASESGNPGPAGRGGPIDCRISFSHVQVPVPEAISFRSMCRNPSNRSHPRAAADLHPFPSGGSPDDSWTEHLG